MCNILSGQTLIHPKSSIKIKLVCAILSLWIITLHRLEGTIIALAAVAAAKSGAKNESDAVWEVAGVGLLLMSSNEASPPPREPECINTQDQVQKLHRRRKNNVDIRS